VLTTNRAAAAPVVLTRERLAGGRASAVVVNSGNANACTGREGRETARLATRLVAQGLGVPEARVLASSTGRIGMQIPRDVFLPGVERAVAALSPKGFADAAQAICTTDAFPKTAVRRLRLGGREVTIAAMGKGAGMIAPELATLLVYVCTDAALDRRVAQRALADAADGSFNAISVDGDMSTNDTLLLLASGAAGNATVRPGTRDAARFGAALTDALAEIAKLCVLDGEGATKCIEVVVRGAASDDDARAMARAIATSTLCKCAFAGGDPNWGRFVCAAGSAGRALDADRVDVVIDGVVVARRGRPDPKALPRARTRMARREFPIVLDLHLGRGTGRMWSSDLTVDYVHFNAAYTT
jgi:glutamate N-acetyltransferase/amino-acid N-acetyltransferase